MCMSVYVYVRMEVCTLWFMYVCMCMYVCIHSAPARRQPVTVYACMFMYVYVCVRMEVCTLLFMYVCVCMHACIASAESPGALTTGDCVCMYVYVYVCMCEYESLYPFVDVSMYVYVCICVRACTLACACMYGIHVCMPHTACARRIQKNCKQNSCTYDAC